MKHYAIGSIDITDPAWAAEYVTNVTRIVEARGGRYLARTTRIEVMEGERPARQLALLIEWPTREDAVEFYESDEYRPYRDARQAGSAGELLLVPAEDANGIANVP